MTNCLRVIRYAWHLQLALNFVFTVQNISLVIAYLTP
ncbi:DUF3265 domain-containing protein [Vibrio harveyi]